MVAFLSFFFTFKIVDETDVVDVVDWALLALLCLVLVCLYLLNMILVSSADAIVRVSKRPYHIGTLLC